jgi:hypothetical protein
LENVFDNLKRTSGETLPTPRKRKVPITFKKTDTYGCTNYSPIITVEDLVQQEELLNKIYQEIYHINFY